MRRLALNPSYQNTALDRNVEMRNLTPLPNKCYHAKTPITRSLRCAGSSCTAAPSNTCVACHATANLCFGSGWHQSLATRRAKVLTCSCWNACITILAIPAPLTYVSLTSARDAIIDEIKTAPESLVKETYDFILFLKRRRSLEHQGEVPQTATTKPDFLARQQALFGSRVLSDSQTILDELRADRY